MSYSPLIVILAVLVVGAAITLTILFRSAQSGQFRNLKSGAYVIFDDDEPVGDVQDQILHPGDNSSETHDQ
jgi:nitrogen fixation-related uncharacterized protein